MLLAKMIVERIRRDHRRMLSEQFVGQRTRLLVFVGTRIAVTELHQVVIRQAKFSLRSKRARLEQLRFTPQRIVRSGRDKMCRSCGGVIVEVKGKLDFGEREFALCGVTLVGYS